MGKSESEVDRRVGRERVGRVVAVQSVSEPVFATFGVVLALALLSGCTQETQNELGRAVQNWTGTDGVLEVYAGEKLVKRFLDIDKLTTATGTNSSESRPYRFGYGVLDENLNGVVDAGEGKVYFEISDYSTPYVFYENPR